MLGYGMTINNKNNIEKNENWFEKLLFVKRNTKVTKGGRVFGFSVLTVIGNKNGKIGIGKGKAKEVPSAIQKAMEQAKKNLINVCIKNDTIYTKFDFKYNATKIIMTPSYNGRGIISSSSIRAIFEAAGIKNISVKCLGSKNPRVLIKCVLKALIQMHKNMIGINFRKQIN